MRSTLRVTIAQQNAAEHMSGHGWCDWTAMRLFLLILKRQVLSQEYVTSSQPRVSWMLPPLVAVPARCRIPEEFDDCPLLDVASGPGAGAFWGV